MTALRSLMIELGLADGVSNRLRGIDSQIDGIESGLIDTQSGFDDLGRATTEYGRVAGDEIEGVGKDVTELNKQVEQSADVTAAAAADMAISWGKVGAAIGGAAIAAEAFVRSQQDYYVTAAKISHITGLERDEVVGLAVELTNISNSIDDAYGVMEVGARQGLRTRDELAAYVKVWDDIGTASDENAVELARAAISLRSVGIEARDLTDAYDTFGFVMTHTTSSVSDFLRLTGYMARDMDQYGMGVSDVAITLAALEEKGMGAADARRALRSAMSSAKGDVTALYRELGITDEQLARLNEEIKGGADYITEMGDAYNSTRSPLQYLQVEVTKLSNLLGADLNPVIGASSAVLSGLSTALLTAATAKYVFADASIKTLIPSLAASTASAWAFTAALLANPITWIVLGIVGLGAALYLLASNWDDISGWFMDRWEQVGSVVTGAIDWIRNAWDSTVGAIVAGAEWLGDKLQFFGHLFPVTAPIAGMNLLRDNWDTVVGAIGAGWDWLVGAAQDGAAWLGETIGAGLSGIIDLFWQYTPLGIVIRQWDEITGYLEGIDLFETGKDILLGLVRGILDVGQQAIDAVMGIGEGILNAVTGFFGISSPSKLMQEMGGHVGEGFALGVAQSMPENIPLPEMPAAATLNGEYATAWTEPTIKPLAGDVQYSSVIAGPDVPALTGELTYETRVSEPTIVDRAGTVVYETEVSEPTIAALTGAITYVATVLEPAIPLLTGVVTYLSEVLRPEVPALAGVVEYQGVLVGLPDIDDLTGRAEFGGREIDDTRASTGPETDNLPDLIIYSPERDAPYMAGERSGDLVYSPTIHVTAGTSDANEIATMVDRRLRQTFDRHAELYFARQRRRAAL